MGVEDREGYRKDQAPRQSAAAARPGAEAWGAAGVLRRNAAWVITFAILAAALLAFAALSWILRARSDAAAQAMIQSLPNALQQSQLEGQKLQRESEEREAARLARLQQQDAQRSRAVAQQQRAEEEAQRAEVAAVERKAKAWEKFYRKPTSCNDASTMECANAYIRAKRLFEEKYARGEL
jgi:flagellar motor protein MotB